MFGTSWKQTWTKTAKKSKNSSVFVCGQNEVFKIEYEHPGGSLGKTTEYSVTDLQFNCTMEESIGSKVTGHVPGG